MSPAAEELLQFDMASIRQSVTSLHGQEPQFWIHDPESYEKNGRLLRDSPAPRLLAYSPADRIVYACDGCNTCTRRMDVGLESLSPAELQTFAENNDLRFDLLERLRLIGFPSRASGDISP